LTDQRWLFFGLFPGAATRQQARYTHFCLSIRMMLDLAEYEVFSAPLVNSIPREDSLMFFAYFGPETMMPVASVIAATVGVIMMFGRNILLFGRGLVRRAWPGSRQR
jgi:hypothetical protein